MEGRGERARENEGEKATAGRRARVGALVRTSAHWRAAMLAVQLEGRSRSVLGAATVESGPFTNWAAAWAARRLCVCLSCSVVSNGIRVAKDAHALAHPSE
eukprot:6192907-Pleurochrysis_carterae.AAC.1